MGRMIFPSLPVADLERSVDFWRGLGFAFHEEFTDDKAACMVVSDDAFVMLLTESLFSTFTRKELADTSKHSEAIWALSTESRQEVDLLTDRALATGGSYSRGPQEEGFTYSRGFEDPDGHLWELVYMDPAALEVLA